MFFFLAFESKIRIHQEVEVRQKMGDSPSMTSMRNP